MEEFTSALSMESFIAWAKPVNQPRKLTRRHPLVRSEFTAQARLLGELVKPATITSPDSKRESNLMSSKTKQTIRSVQISKAKSSLNSLVKRVHRDHEYLILKDNGTPLAAVMDIDEFEDYLELNDPKVRRDIEQSTKEFREGKGRPAREFLAELEAEQRQTRRSRTGKV